MFVKKDKKIDKKIWKDKKYKLELHCTLKGKKCNATEKSYRNMYDYKKIICTLCKKRYKCTKQIISKLEKSTDFQMNLHWEK